MKRTKILSAILAATVAITSATVAVGCGGSVEKVDSTKTQLYVANYNGGVGEKWLDNAKARFETAYAEYEFEPGTGKKGAQIIIDHNKSYDGLSLITSLPTDARNDIIFTNGANYFDFIPYLYDLSSLINKKNADDNNKSIADKLDAEQIEFFTVNNGIYALPSYELYGDFTYDAGVFKSKKLYFSDTIDVADTEFPGTRRFIVNDSTKKSCGPDGIYGTDDDGLPSSVQEFYKLMEKMSKNNVKAFTWTGASTHYTNGLLRSMFANLSGADAIYALSHFNSRGNPIEIVTGFDSNKKPIIENIVLTEENAYLIKQAAGIYYAIELAQRLYSNSKYYYGGSTSSTFSHLSAMEAFLNSGLDGSDYIGMIIDGNWWWNEANDDGQMDRLEYDYPETYTSKDPRVMHMPVQYAGTVTEGNGKSPVVYRGIGSGGAMLVNKNIEDKTVKLMEEFISFIYTDAELLEFTKITNGIFRGVNYDYSSIIGSLNSFAQSSLKLRDTAIAAGSYVSNESNNMIYRQNKAAFGLGNEFWRSGGTTFTVDAFINPNTTVQDAINYFNGFKIDKDQWTAMRSGR